MVAKVKREDLSKPHGIYDAFLRVCLRWQLSRDDQFKLLGFEPNDPFCQRLLSGPIRRASLDVEDRAGYVVSIGIGLFSLFGNSEEAEREWMNQTRARLQNKSPLSFILDGRMENLFVVDGMVRRERGI